MAVLIIGNIGLYLQASTPQFFNCRSSLFGISPMAYIINGYIRSQLSQPKGNGSADATPPLLPVLFYLVHSSEE